MATAKTKRTPRSKAAVAEQSVETEVTPVVETAKPVKEVQVKAKEKRSFDLHEYVQVRNGFHGKLVYKSKKTGELFVWNEFGETLDIELLELRDAKVSNKKMFVNNYFIIEDDEVLEYLGLKKFYNHSLPMDEFDEIFDLPPEDLKQLIGELSEGQRSSVAYRARQLVNHKAIDSIRTIETLEEALKTQLIDRD